MPPLTRDSIKTHRFRLGLVGDTKQGKSRIASTSERPFIFDGENGLVSCLDILTSPERANPEPFGYYFPEAFQNNDPKFPTGWKTFKKVVEAFSRREMFKLDGVEIDPNKYRTCVFDSFTFLLDLAWNEGIADFMRDGGRNAYAKYQTYAEECKWLKRMGLKLHDTGFDLVAVFHTMDRERDPKTAEVTNHQPYMEGRAAPQIILPLFDEFWGVTGRKVLTKGGELFETTAHTSQFGKFQCIGSKHNYPSNITNPDLTQLFQQFRAA